MKLITFLSITALCAITLFSACSNDGDAARDAAIESLTPATPAGDAANPAAPATTTPAAEPPQNAAGVWHYTCPKGCEGGAGSAIACPKCGTTLVHNTTYHGNSGNTTTPAVQNAGDAGSQTITPTQPPTQTPEPAQNAKGVWHYTCPGGCAGGAGSAIACAKCGKTLAHNQAYHQ
jgi:outer membrane biosynthesis protein TonB